MRLRGKMWSISVFFSSFPGPEEMLLIVESASGKRAPHPQDLDRRFHMPGLSGCTVQGVGGGRGAVVYIAS